MVRRGDGLAARLLLVGGLPSAPPGLLPLPGRPSGTPFDRGDVPKHLTHDPPDLVLVFRALATPLEPRSQPIPKDRPVPPLLALPACRPSAGSLPLRPLPAHPGEPACTFGSGIPSPDVPFRPRGLAPPRRLAPQRACGFVAPRYRPWGSPRFSPDIHHPGPEGPLADTVTSPRRGHPSKGSPRLQPYRVTAAVASVQLPRFPRHDVSTVADGPEGRADTRRSQAKRRFGSGRTPRTSPGRRHIRTSPRARTGEAGRFDRRARRRGTSRGPHHLQGIDVSSRDAPAHRGEPPRRDRRGPRVSA
jgi:hypothetical protein